MNCYDRSLLLLWVILLCFYTCSFACFHYKMILVILSLLETPHSLIWTSCQQGCCPRFASCNQKSCTAEMSMKAIFAFCDIMQFQEWKKKIQNGSFRADWRLIFWLLGLSAFSTMKQWLQCLKSDFFEAADPKLTVHTDERQGLLLFFLGLSWIASTKAHVNLDLDTAFPTEEDFMCVHNHTCTNLGTVTLSW